MHERYHDYRGYVIIKQGHNLWSIKGDERPRKLYSTKEACEMMISSWVMKIKNEIQNIEIEKRIKVS